MHCPNTRKPYCYPEYLQDFIRHHTIITALCHPEPVEG